MLRIGLTGGIGSGKSTVAGCFRALQVPTVDADRIAKDLVAPGQPALEKVAGLFGREILNRDGSLNRTDLARRIFESATARAAVEALLHPLVYAAITERLPAFEPVPYCVLEIPLLIESGGVTFVDRILVVDCPDRLRIERIKRRTGYDDATIGKIFASQLPRAVRLSHASELIVNGSDTANLAARVEALDHWYRELAGSIPAEISG